MKGEVPQNYREIMDLKEVIGELLQQIEPLPKFREAMKGTGGNISPN